MSGATLASDGSAYFTITPRNGLPPGLHQARLYLEGPGSGGPQHVLIVQFTVLAPDPTPPPQTFNVNVRSQVNAGTATSPIWTDVAGIYAVHQLAPGDSVTIQRPLRPGYTAANPPWHFIGLEGNMVATHVVHNTTDGSVTVTMPPGGRHIEVIARWNPPPVANQQLTILNYPALGFAGSSTARPAGQTISGSRSPGSPVILEAGYRSGWTFSGWDVTPHLNHPLNNESETFNMPSHPVTITARWVQNGAVSRNLTVFQSQGGLLLMDNVTRFEGTSVTINAGAREGYTFTGWSVVGSTVTIPPTTIATFIMPNANITVTGNWERRSHNVSISDVGLPGGVVPSGTRIVGTNPHNVNASVSVYPGTPPAGYRFAGWSPPAGVVGTFPNNGPAQFTMPDNNVTITANWIPLGATVSNLSIRQYPGAQTVTTQRSAGEPVTLIAAPRQGMVFHYWRVVYPLSNPPVINPNNVYRTYFIMPESNVTVEAQWNPAPTPTHTVTLLNSPHWPGANNAGGNYGHQSVMGGHNDREYGTWVYIDSGRRQGHNFTSFSSIPTVEFEQVNAGPNFRYRFRMPDSNITIWANWAPYTVPIRQVNINNRVYNTTNTIPTGRIDRQTTDGLRFAQGHEHVTVDAGTIHGYYFVQWEVSPADLILVANRRNSVQTFRMPNSDVTLTAIWRRVPTGTHSVSINHSPHIRIGELAVVTGTIPAHAANESPTHVIGSTVNVFTAARPGYTFTGWTVSPAFVVLSNATVTLPPVAAHSTSFTMPDEPVTITANWASNTIPQLATPVVTLSGSTITWPAVPNATGYRIYVGGQEVASVTSTTLSFNFDHLAPPLGVGTHLVQVRAIGNGVSHTDSNLSVARSLVNIPPITAASIRPTGLSITNSTLRWNPVFNAARYYIYVNNTRRAVISNVNTSTFSITSPSFDLATLNNPRLTRGGAGYDIQVRAVVGSVTSYLSEVRRFYDAVPPLPPPTNVRITGNPTLHWDFPTTGHPDLVGFRIYVNGQASQHMVGPTARSFPIANLGLTSGTYLIGVRAVSTGVDNSDSYLSTFVQYTSSTLPALNTPINLAINNHILSWNAVPNATGYRIYVNGQPSTAGIIGGLSFNLANLNLGAGTHLIQVRAIGNDITHTDSAISAFVSYVLNTGQSSGNSNTGSGNTRTAQYVATFNPGAGSFPAGEDGLRMGPSGFTINSFTNVPSRAGYTFGGWSIGGNPVSLPLTVSSDVTLNAIWNRIEGPAASPTPAPAGNRPNPQTGAFGLLNIMGVLVLTGGSIVAVKILGRRKNAK